MKPPHVVIVNQNALLEADLRPRREAETLAAAGNAVTLVGGSDSPETVPVLTAAGVSLELFPQPTGGNGVAGQIREQNQAMARALLAVRRASRCAPVAAVHAGNPPDNFGTAARRRFDEQICWERAGGPRLVARYDRLLGSGHAG